MKGLFIFLIGVICYGNKDLPVYKDSISVSIDTAVVIKKIQSDFISINKQLKLFKKKTRDAFGMSAEGGEVTGYYNKGTLKKIHSVFYGETGKVESDYYFDNKELFFLYRKDIFYDKPMYIKGFKIKNTIEKRYYLYHAKVIKTIVKPNSSILSYNEIKGELKQVMDVLDEK